MAAQFSSITAVSPYRRQTVQGRMIAASAQPGVFWPRAQNGAVSGISPVADWPARMSPMNRRVKASTSMLKAAASQKIWASPVQPMRSSRCGQSVGTPRKLPRWLHRVLRTIAWISGLSIRAAPDRGASLCSTTPSTASGEKAPGQPVIST